MKVPEVILRQQWEALLRYTHIADTITISKVQKYLATVGNNNSDKFYKMPSMRLHGDSVLYCL